MKHKYRDILTVSWRMSFPFTCRAAHVYAGLYRASQKYPAPFRHHSIQKSNTVYERLTTKNIHSYSSTGGRKPCNSRKEPAETLDFSGLAEMERFELSRAFTPLLHFECRPFNRLGTSPDEHDSVCRNFRAAVLPLLTQFTLCHISLIFASSKKRDCRRPADSNSLSAAVQMPVSRFTPTRQDTAAGQRAAAARSGSRLISAGSFC